MFWCFVERNMFIMFVVLIVKLLVGGMILFKEVIFDCICFVVICLLLE